LRIGVDETTIFNWEAGTASPGLRALPAVIRFLDYDPRPIPEATDLGRLIRHLRRRQGLSMNAPADRLGVDPTTVRGWEQRGHKPRPQLRARPGVSSKARAVTHACSRRAGPYFRARRRSF
jgi:DNA-binding transcriptional regulator YiaG